MIASPDLALVHALRDAVPASLAGGSASWTSRASGAIGVLYLPATERWSHYFQATLSAQSDAVIHVDATSAVEPLERMALWRPGSRPRRTPRACERNRGGRWAWTGLTSCTR